MSKVVKNNLTAQNSYNKLYDKLQNYSGVLLLIWKTLLKRRKSYYSCSWSFSWISLKDQVLLPFDHLPAQATRRALGSCWIAGAHPPILPYLRIHVLWKQSIAWTQMDPPWQLCGWVTKHADVLRSLSEQLGCISWLWLCLLCQG